jgi:MarR family transcriptional regulator, transcriptional regulator for hemolysin
VERTIVQPRPRLGYLVHDVARLFRAEFAVRAFKHRMTQTHMRTIAYLGRMEGCSQRELAEVIEVRPITLGRQIDLLEASGLIERRPDPVDRRAVCLYLTPRSRARLEQLHEIGDGIYDRATRNLSKAERETLLRLLETVRETLAQDRAQQREEGTHSGAVSHHGH